MNEEENIIYIYVYIHKINSKFKMYDSTNTFLKDPMGNKTITFKVDKPLATIFSMGVSLHVKLL